jgi:aryl-alcohol dehydrogenase-like predicted oxidoreductase
MLDRRIEREMVPMAQTYGVALNVWAPIAGGLLSGLYKRGEAPPPGSRYADPRIGQNYAHRYNEGVFAANDVLGPMADEKEKSVAQVALAWVINQPGITTAITGPEKHSDIKDSLGALSVKITDEDRARIDAASPPGRMSSPFYEADANQFRPHLHRW